MEETQTTPSRVEQACRADLHCHSTASQESKLGVQRAAGLPECATPPEEVYELAKRRGMDFVTITDHDTISGVLRIADRPDVFVSVELTAYFRGDRLGGGQQAVHVPCLGAPVELEEDAASDPAALFETFTTVAPGKLCWGPPT
jgi:hypothetical protein